MAHKWHLSISLQTPAHAEKS